MKAYCIFDVREILDPDKLERYTRGVLATVQAHGGRYLNVGGNCRVVEGDWKPNFPVLLEFPSTEQANAWYDSSDYAALRQMRLEASRGDGVIIEPQPGELRDHLVGKAG